MADVVVLNKIDTADRAAIAAVRRNIRSVNPNAIIVEAASPITVEDPAAIAGAKVLVVEDGPTCWQSGRNWPARSPNDSIAWPPAATKGDMAAQDGTPAPSGGAG